MRQYYRERFGAETVCIGYGADMAPPQQNGLLDRLGLEPGRYFLLVGRLVPENCAHHLVDAYEELGSDLKCVVVGDAPYARSYIDDLHRRGPHVVFPGYVFGDGYRELMYNAYAVVLCSEVGGSHPVLIEAMAAGNCVVVNDTPANLEVIGDAGIPYEGRCAPRALARELQELERDPAKVEAYRRRARARAQSLFSWDAVTDQYERLFQQLTGARVLDGRKPVLAASDAADDRC
jgi:glycosyltransferase involved in cell wall biosynthesis